MKVPLQSSKGTSRSNPALFCLNLEPSSALSSSPKAKTASLPSHSAGSYSIPLPPIVAVTRSNPACLWCHSCLIHFEVKFGFPFPLERGLLEIIWYDDVFNHSKFCTFWGALLRRFPKNSICPHQLVCTSYSKSAFKIQRSLNFWFLLSVFAQTKIVRIST